VTDRPRQLSVRIFVTKLTIEKGRAGPDGALRAFFEASTSVLSGADSVILEAAMRSPNHVLLVLENPDEETLERVTERAAKDTEYYINLKVALESAEGPVAEEVPAAVSYPLPAADGDDL